MMKCNNCFVFLNEDCECAVYEDRPGVCREYGMRPDLPCPFFNEKGRMRSLAKRKRTQRMINRNLKDVLERKKEAYGKGIITDNRAGTISQIRLGMKQ